MYIYIYTYEGVKKQQETCKTFLLGIILIRKKKIQNKNKNTKQYKNNEKNQSITFCCGDYRDKHGGGEQGQEGPKGTPLGPSFLEKPEKKKGKDWLALRLQPATKMTRVWVLPAVENSGKQRTHAVSSSPTDCISKMCSGAWKVLVTSFISLFTSKLSLKLSTQKQSLETDWLCVHRNTNTTRYVLAGLLWRQLQRIGITKSSGYLMKF